MSFEHYFTEAKAKIYGFVENLFLSPEGKVFVCGNISYNGISLIGIADQAGNWLFEGLKDGADLPFHLSNCPLPNTPCFVRNVHFLSEGSVVATGRFPEGGIAKFNHEGKRDEKFSKRILKFCNPLTTVVGSAILGNDDILVYGDISQNPALNSAIITADGDLLLDVSKRLGEIWQAVSISDKSVLAVFKNSRKYFLSVISADGYVNELETQKISWARLADDGDLGMAVSPEGDISFWRYHRGTAVFFAKKNLEPDSEKVLAVCRFLKSKKELQIIYGDSQALWLPQEKLFFYDCGPGRNRSGMILDPKSGFDQSLMYRFDTPGPRGYERANKGSALWLSNEKKIMMAELFIRRYGDDHPSPITRLSLVNLDE